MGRKKAAPQPLSLPHTNLNIASKVVSSRTTSNSFDPPIAAPTNTSAAGSLAPTPATISSTSAEPSPTNSRSPASASTRISPFSSRFAQKRPQTARPGQQPTTADFDNFGQRCASQPFVEDQEQPQKPAGLPHIASTYSPSSAPLRSTKPLSQSHTPTEAHGQKQVHHEPKRSKGFFHFAKPSKSFNQAKLATPQQSTQSRDEPQSITIHRADTSGSNKAGYSTPDIARTQSPESVGARQLQLRPSQSQLSLSSQGDRESASAAPKRKPFGLLKRTKSLRDNLRDVANPSELRHDPMPSPAPQSTKGSVSPLSQGVHSQQQTDHTRREGMKSTARNPSEDRHALHEGQNTREHNRDKSPHVAAAPTPAPAPAPGPAPVRENGHSTFFSGLKNSSTKAAGMFNRGFFKGHRGASTNDHQPSYEDEHYELKVLNLPLAAQTRKTRISKRLEDSRDKTEFWMPAFPWRAIDYLNFKGCEVEGLYRVPGSGPQIKKWQRRFDEEHDVNLFEAEDLYDINIIGSMLKAWLRELPDELFPKAAQERIARECAGAETVPQMLIDELSNLSPFQYYLLFAITCHLSLLLANADKNKMDFRNLCICFQPCMKIDAFCFKFLVCDWRDCWKGCVNEAAYIEQEYILLDEPPPQGLSQSSEPAKSVSTPAANAASRRSPSETSQRSTSSAHAIDAGRAPREAKLQESQSKGSIGSNGSTISTTLTLNSEQEPTKARSGELRRLSPIQPLSPLGFH